MCEDDIWSEGNIHKIPRSVRCKNREKYVSKKTIIYDNIYMIRQLAYIHRVARISLFSEKKKKKKYKMHSTVFSTPWTKPHKISY